MEKSVEAKLQGKGKARPQRSEDILKEKFEDVYI